MRDDFSQATRIQLAKRAGYRCSNPNCRKLTIGPADEQNKSIDIGEASHITAASEGGPRFNPELSSEERKSIKNGIWLCRSCAKMIDSDTDYYTVDRLTEWKKTVENEARREIRSFNRYNINSQDINILEFVRICFDRPAYMDDFYCEGCVEHLMDALDATVYALNTGILRDRTGKTVAQCKGKSALMNSSWREQIELITEKVYDIKRMLEKAIENGSFVQKQQDSEGESWYYFQDRTLCDLINKSREDIIISLSNVLEEAGIPMLDFRKRKYNY